MKDSLILSMILSLSLLGPGMCTDVYFSPDGGVQDQIIKRINLSTSTIEVAMYSFSSASLAQALADASKRGVHVRMIRDRTQSAEKNDENIFLSSKGVQIQIISGKGRGIMHDKFAVFDKKEVFTGSYNWTENAEKNNHENAIFINEPKVINSYESEFEKLWKI